MSFKPSSFWRGSVRRQLILTVAGVHAVLMTLFVWDVTGRQREHVLQMQTDQAEALAHSLATSSGGWLAARDIAGLQEIVEAQSRYPELIFAMLLDTRGLVLAHTDRARLGQYVRDLPVGVTQDVRHRTPELVDVITPVLLSDHQVGWVRVGLGQRAAGAQLRRNLLNGLLYSLAAIGLGTIVAAILGTRLTAGLYAIRRVASAVRSGRRTERVPDLGPDEIGQLGGDFNGMLDTLEASDAQVRLQGAALEAASNAVVITGCDGRIRWVNAAFTTLTGYTREEAAGRLPGELLKSGQHDREFYRQMWDTILAGQTWQGVFINRRKDRSLYRDETTITPLKDHRGEVTHFIAIKQDVTERTEADVALRKSEERFRLLFENSPVANWEEDFSAIMDRLDGLRAQGVTDLGAHLERHPEVEQECLGLVRIVDVNQAAVKMHRASSKDALLRGLAATFAPESLATFRRELIGLWEGRTAMALDAVVRTLDGERLQVVIYWSVSPGHERRFTRVLLSLVDITELKRAEQTLRASEENLTRAQAVAQTGSWQLDIPRNRLTWSAEAYRLFGVPPGQALTLEDFAARIHPEDLSRVLAAWTAALAGAPYDVEHRILVGTEIKWVRERAEIIRDAHGAALEGIGTVQDITVRKQGEDALRRSNRELRAISSCNQALIRAADERSLLRDICRIICGEAGYCMAWVGLAENDEAKSVRPVAWAGNEAGFLTEVKVSWAESEPGVCTAGTAIRTGKACSVHDIALDTSKLTWRDDALKRGYRAGISLPLNDEAGRTYGALTLFASEPGAFPPDEIRLLTELADDLAYGITVLRGREVRMHTEQALRESEQRFRQVTESIDEVFWLTDATLTRVDYVSPAYSHIWGRSCESLYADPGSWLAAIYPDDQERVRDEEQKLAAAGSYNLEYRISRPDGEVRWIRERAFPIRDAGGQMVRIAGVAEDITARKQLEQQFLHAQRMEAIGTLASGIAHDLNNILAPMLMAAGLLKEQLVSAKDREVLAMVESGAQRGAAIIRQLLTFSRGAEGARMSIQPRHLIKEMGQIMRETFPRNIQIDAVNPAQLWTVRADATQLHQVLMNLCVNARDAMPQGGRLTLSARNVTVGEADMALHPKARVGPYVVVTVADTGYGIPPEIQERIFDPFFTTKEVGKGTGLGLSTVRTIVANHEGFVLVRSAAGQGSSFQVYLPAEAEGTAAPAHASATPFPVGDGELILVVDDEASIRSTMQRILEIHRYRVLALADGREAINVYLQNRDTVRLVIVDLMMPLMDGLALIRALRVVDPNVRVVAVSGMDMEANRAELASLGVTETLPKPFEPRALLEAIQRQVTSDR